MNIDFSVDKPIFLQISDGIADAILSGAFEEESQIPSITEFAVQYKINPATALKGVNILVDQEIIYKKRGIGMFVKAGAVEKLQSSRKNEFFEHYITNAVEEAVRLGITKEEMKSMIERGYEYERN